MYKIIGADGKQYGPVTAEQLRLWIREGRANAQTRAQAEGTDEWKPLGEFLEFADQTPAAAPAALLDPAAIAARDYRVDIGACVSRSWELLKNNLAVLIGASLIYGLIMIAFALISMIPFVSILSEIAQVIVGGPLVGGLYWVFLCRLRGEPAEASDVFAGFKRAFGNLILVQLVSGILAFLAVIPGLVMAGIGIALTFAGRGHGHMAMQAPGVALIVFGAILFLAGICVAVYLTNCWVFSLPLVVDKRMGFWGAMKLSRTVVRKHWWGVFGFMFVMGLLGIAGLLVCGVGIIFTAPLAMGAIAYFYNDVFGTASAPAA
jgi:uncharacterized membrane protein